jgi:hypothetical protein
MQASERASEHGRVFLDSHAGSDKAHVQYMLDGAIGASHAFDVSGEGHNCVLRTAHMGLRAFAELGLLGVNHTIPTCLRASPENTDYDVVRKYLAVAFQAKLGVLLAEDCKATNPRNGSMITQYNEVIGQLLRQADAGGFMLDNVVLEVLAEATGASFLALTGLWAPQDGIVVPISHIQAEYFGPLGSNVASADLGQCICILVTGRKEVAHGYILVPGRSGFRLRAGFDVGARVVDVLLPHGRCIHVHFDAWL